MRKFFALLLGFILALSLCGCTPKTEYDDKEIARIQSAWVEGMSAFRCDYVRIFDFETGTVTDICQADIDELPEEVLPNEYREGYNTPKTVTTFTEEQGQSFLKKTKSLGFLAWKDRYETDDIICDGGHETVTVTFTDGTVKSTYIYYKDPPNYEKIRTAFTDLLGASLYWQRQSV
ncbi:MAG: hypothetical protein K2N84_01550 [Clostridia bacterium]|nr:hypothetical protein [Clostridia bacterium]